MPEGSVEGEDGVEDRRGPGHASAAQPSEEPRFKGDGGSDLESRSASGLTRKLSVARADPVDKAELRQPDVLEAKQLAYFCEARHDVGEGNEEVVAGESMMSKWRQKERLKTTAVALVLCLNIGVDPPDVMKISPCARLECWVDPLSMQPPKALDTIGKNLQAQYERWQPRAKYKMHLDPTADDAKKVAVSCRRAAKNERVLFHYNGHGVPRPTANGEIWVFNKAYTQYIPLSIYDLQAWVGSPCIYVFDCSAAGMIVASYRHFAEQRAKESLKADPGREPEDPMKECILLAACGANEMLPQNPDLPADVFTACLTTPIKVALRWFCAKSLLCSEGLTRDLIDRIPGKQTDRKTPLGELNWIFTAITDTIAWNTLPRALFQKLFRQDLLVASLFRNFLLAERIMRASNCTPVSFPRLPPTHQHPMWQAWDMAAEMCLLQLPPIVNSDVNVEFQSSPFFSEQLTAFELWLQHGSKDKKPPEQLPIVLQVLLSQVHRLRALWLLGCFLDMGPWAVDLALSVGIFPYVLKLLQTTATDLRETLIFIWTKILALDRSCQDLVKDNGHTYFINYLGLREERPARSCAQACFVLAIICDSHPRGCQLCHQAGFLKVLVELLTAPANCLPPHQKDFHDPDTGLLVKWLCLSLGKLVQGMPSVAAVAMGMGVTEILEKRQYVSNPEVRAAAVFALGALIKGKDEDEILPREEGFRPPTDPSDADRLANERALACHLQGSVYDASPLVRAEVALGLGRLAHGHHVLFQDAVSSHQRRHREEMRAQQAAASSSASAAHSMPSSAGGRMYQYAPSSLGENASSSAKSLGDTGIASSGAPPRDSGPRSLPSGAYAANQIPAPGGKGGGSEATTMSSASPVESAPMASSPAVFAAAHSDRSSPHQDLSSGSTGESPISSLGNYASRDAARVGEGLYGHVLDSLLTLAQDPAPNVAKLSNAVLHAANVQLTPISHGTGHVPASKSAVQLAQMETARSGPVPPSSLPASASVSNLALSLAAPPSSSKWNPRTLWRAGSKQPPSGAASPCSPAAPIAETTQRKPFVLTQVQGESNGMQRAHSAQSSDVGDLPPLGHGRKLGSAEDVRSTDERSQSAKLLESPAFAAAARYFSEPLNDSATKEWVASGHSSGFGCPHKSVKAQWQPWRVESRQHDQDVSVSALRTLGRSGELKFRLDQVETIPTDSMGNACLLLHPFRPLLVAVDYAGVVRVFSSRKPYTMKNAFHISTGDGIDATQRGRSPQPTTCSVVNIWQINQVFNGLLLSGSADGSVRVWRDYTFPRTQRLATSWQSVPVTPGAINAVYPRTVYDWHERSSSLYSSGGAQPGQVHRWDLRQEYCTQMVRAGRDSHGASQPLSFLSTSKHQDSLLLAATHDTVRLFDLRAAGREAASLRPHSTAHPMMGMVAEPGGQAHHLVTATAAGELRFIDFRMGSDSKGKMGVYKTLQAHSKGSITAIEGHPYAPIIATGTTTQVVKLWSASGEQRGVVRTQTSLLNSQRIGPISCLNFHPHRPLLATGSADSLVTMYPVEPMQRESTSAVERETSALSIK